MHVKVECSVGGKMNQKKAILEHGGFKVGDRVSLKIKSGPDGLGKITRIFRVKVADSENKKKIASGWKAPWKWEMAFDVFFEESKGGWKPMFLNELRKGA
jgi:hypothetical protein